MREKVILITRTYNNPKIKHFIERFYENNVSVNYELFEKIIVLVKVKHKNEPYFTQAVLSRISNYEILKRLDIVHVKQWGVASGALNIGLKNAFDRKKLDYVLIASPDIEIKKNHVDRMSKILTDDKNILVVGYALDNGHNLDNSSDALKVPWNTCAMWNVELSNNC